LFLIRNQEVVGSNMCKCIYSLDMYSFCQYPLENGYPQMMRLHDYVTWAIRFSIKPPCRPRAMKFCFIPIGSTAMGKHGVNGPRLHG
jgi:hypothetical protein